jgi:hypothetical protein
MGKSTGKAIFSIAGFFIGAGGWGQKLLGMVGNSLGAGLYGASLMSSIWTATHQGGSTSYSFDTATNQIANDQMIPIVYGTRKYSGALETWKSSTSTASSMNKDVVLCEGEIEGIQGITANCISIGGYQTIFEVENIAYADATIRIQETDNPTGNDRLMTLYANGTSDQLIMQGDGDLKDDSSNDFQCNMGLFVQHIEKLGKGWRVLDFNGCSATPETVKPFDVQACYKTPIAVTGQQETKSTYSLYTGSASQTPPTNYSVTGSYKNTAWIRANLVATSTLSYSNPNIACIIKGKLVYDTRTSLTAYSENPAMCLRDYLLNKRYGMGRWLSEEMLDADSFEEVADYCDGSVTYVDAYGVTVTEPRYALNLILAQKRKHLDNIQDILAVFGGFLSISGNKIYLRMEKQESSSYSFTENNMLEVKFDYDGLTSCPNQYNIKYYDPAQNWALISVQVNDYADQDARGAIIPKEVTLQGCTSQGQALRLGRIYKAINRLNGAVITFSTGTFAMHLQPGDICTISYRSLSNAPFRIMNTAEENGKWKIQAQQYNASIYDDALGAQITIGNYVTTPSALVETVPYVTDLSATQNYRELGDGTIVTDIKLAWLSTYMNYKNADIYMLSDNPAMDEIDVSINELDGSWNSITASSNTWIYAGTGTNSFFVTNVTKGLTYTFKVVTVNTSSRRSDLDNSPTIDVTVHSKTYQPTTPNDFTVDITTVCTWNWSTSDSDVDYYELRTDTNTGSSTNLLVKTSSTKATVTPSSRSGTAYLYSHNTAEEYSSAATLTWSKTAPIAPVVTITSIFQGLIITTDVLPTNATGISVHTNDGTGTVIYSSANNSYTFKSTAGIYDISVAFTDIFGEGTLSAVQSFTISATIDPALIAAESLSLAKMDTTIQAAVAAAQASVDTTTFNTAISGRVSYTDFNSEVNTLVQVDETNASAIQQASYQITTTVAILNSDPGATPQYTAISQLKQTADGITTTVQDFKDYQNGQNTGFSSQITQNASNITSVVTELNTNLENCGYTAIAQAASAIQLRATSANLISLINVCPEAITIDSKYIHITGTTLFDDSVIVNRMLQAQSVTADKMSVTSLSAVSATIGTLRTATTGARTEISDNLIQVFDTNNVLRVRIGVFD